MTPEESRQIKECCKLDYIEYLKSEQWKFKRLQVLKRDNHICKDCGKIAGYVHHLNYDYIDKLEEINFCITLCKKCHAKRHNITLFN